jgi:hypothetical protein
MNRFRTISIANVLVAGLVATLIGVGAASAAPSQWERYVSEYGPEPSFCDDLIQHGVVTGKTRVTQHGDGQSYYYDEGEFTETWTNPEDPSDFATVTGSYKQSALKVTDNGNGTYQVLFAGPGTTNVYDGDTLIAHQAGLSRFILLFDDAGTPGDITDDSVIAHLGTVKEVGSTFFICDPILDVVG